MKNTGINYAVMRHADHSSNIVTPTGQKQIELSAGKLTAFLEENNISEIEIWHSPQNRAKETATYLQKNLLVKSLVKEKGFLNCDYEEIQDNLPNQDSFIVMISHEPDIAYYLEKKYQSYVDVYQCDIFIGSQKL